MVLWDVAPPLESPLSDLSEMNIRSAPNGRGAVLARDHSYASVFI
jgi:hypothetical protein